MKESKYVTIMIVPEGGEDRRGFRMKQWLFKTILISGSVLALGIVLFFILYGGIIAKAAQAEKLAKENESLKRYYYKVQILEEYLQKNREVVGRLTEIAGIDFEFPPLPEDSVLFAMYERNRIASTALSNTSDFTYPSGLPLTGFISQDFELADQSHYHPGVDIACAVGTPVLATAHGKVEYASFDSTYGHMVVLRHNDSTQTLYGHNDSLLVDVGQEILAGSRIALSGNTGVSSAPHLHYEIRINDEPIDPMGKQ